MERKFLSTFSFFGVLLLVLASTNAAPEETAQAHKKQERDHSKVSTIRKQDDRSNMDSQGFLDCEFEFPCQLISLTRDGRIRSGSLQKDVKIIQSNDKDLSWEAIEQGGLKMGGAASREVGVDILAPECPGTCNYPSNFQACAATCIALRTSDCYYSDCFHDCFHCLCKPEATFTCKCLPCKEYALCGLTTAAFCDMFPFASCERIGTCLPAETCKVNKCEKPDQFQNCALSCINKITDTESCAYSQCFHDCFHCTCETKDFDCKCFTNELGPACGLGSNS